MILSDATLQKWRTETEGQFFDRKSARLAPKELASHISAFANASGGTVVLGIENSGEVTGVNRDQENSLRQAGIHLAGRPGQCRYAQRLLDSGRLHPYLHV